MGVTEKGNKNHLVYIFSSFWKLVSFPNFFLAHANSLMHFYSLETNHGSGRKQVMSSLKGGIKFGVSDVSSVSNIPWLSDSVLETLGRQEKANQD